MELDSVLVIGGGIGGLTAAIALRRKGFAVEVVEKDPEWSVYGVGIIQQFNVIRAMASLDLLDAYMEKAYGFDRTVLFAGPAGQQVADFNTPPTCGRRPPIKRGNPTARPAKGLGGSGPSAWRHHPPWDDCGDNHG